MENEEKIFGIYPGIIKDTSEVDNYDEIDLYFMIDSIGGMIWRLNHDMADGRIERVDLTGYQYAIEYCLNQTRKFGVELDEPTPGKHMETTDSYRAWYSFYNNHFKNVLTDDEWDEFQRRKNCGEDYSKFLPKGDWREPLKQKKVKTL